MNKSLIVFFVFYSTLCFASNDLIYSELYYQNKFGVNKLMTAKIIDTDIFINQIKLTTDKKLIYQNQIKRIFTHQAERTRMGRSCIQGEFDLTVVKKGKKTISKGCSEDELYKKILKAYQDILFN